MLSSSCGNAPMPWLNERPGLKSSLMHGSLSQRPSTLLRNSGAGRASCNCIAWDRHRDKSRDTEPIIRRETPPFSRAVDKNSEASGLQSRRFFFRRAYLIGAYATGSGPVLK
jgi:hypothetical protein